jgi:outer membrane lipoprotein-sorting protein
MRGSRDIGGAMRRAGRFFDKGSPTELRKHFDIAAVVSPDRKGTWQVTFTPKRAQMREGVSRVHLWIEQSSLMLQAMKMEYPGGDTRLMEFADVRVNPTVEADAFEPPATR